MALSLKMLICLLSGSLEDASSLAEKHQAIKLAEKFRGGLMDS